MLQGSRATLQRCCPVLYLENNVPEQSPALIRTIRDHRYRLWWHTPYLFNPNNYFGEKHNLYPQVSSKNMLCLPEERLDLLPLVPETLVRINAPGDKVVPSR